MCDFTLFWNAQNLLPVADWRSKDLYFHWTAAPPASVFLTATWSDMHDMAESGTQALNKTARRAIHLLSRCLHIHLPVSGGAHTTRCEDLYIPLPLMQWLMSATAINTANERCWSHSMKHRHCTIYGSPPTVALTTSFVRINNIWAFCSHICGKEVASFQATREWKNLFINIPSLVIKVNINKKGVFVTVVLELELKQLEQFCCLHSTLKTGKGEKVLTRKNLLVPLWSISLSLLLPVCGDTAGTKKQFAYKNNWRWWHLVQLQHSPHDCDRNNWAPGTLLRRLLTFSQLQLIFHQHPFDLFCKPAYSTYMTSMQYNVSLFVVDSCPFITNWNKYLNLRATNQNCKFSHLFTATMPLSLHFCQWNKDKIAANGISEGGWTANLGEE